MEQEDYDELIEFFEHLRKSGRPVIVEGRKDAAALEAVGLRDVIALDQRPLYAVAEEVMGRGRSCVVLTDLDAEGRKLYARLARDLREHGVDVDDRLRNFLFRRTELRQVEGLPRYLERWRRQQVEGRRKRKAA
jgi:5S rRNA maturation endonuclease (ribonuclease M5)